MARPDREIFFGFVWHLIQRSFRSRIDDEIAIGANRDNKQLVESLQGVTAVEPLISTKKYQKFPPADLRFIARDGNAG